VSARGGGVPMSDAYLPSLADGHLALNVMRLAMRGKENRRGGSAGGFRILRGAAAI
jgi:hypothetical protein